MFRKSLIMSCAFLCGESKIIWLRTKNRLAENDFSIGADFFEGLLSGTWSLKVRRKEESLSVPVTKGTDRLL